MLRQKPERWIAISVIVCSLALAALLAVVLGHWELNPHKKRLVLCLSNCTGLAPNSRVSYAGAPVGRVSRIAVIPRAEQQAQEHDGQFYYVRVTLTLDSDVDIGEDAVFAVRQDGVLGSQFVAILPGSPEAPTLADGAVVHGTAPVDLMELAGAGRQLLGDLRPAVAHLNSLAENLDAAVPPLVANVDKFLQDGDAVLSGLGTPENRRRLADLLANLRVVSANLKVVSTNAKAFTASIGERPWRIFWGGPPNVLPTEKEILASPAPVAVAQPK